MTDRPATTPRSKRGSSTKGTTMAWTLLFTAGLLEVCWALSLKPTEGFTRLWPSLLSAALMLSAAFLLTLAVRDLPTGTAYAVFTGMGATGAVAFGILLRDDQPTLGRLAPIGLIITGIVLLRLFGTEARQPTSAQPRQTHAPVSQEERLTNSTCRRSGLPTSS